MTDAPMLTKGRLDEIISVLNELAPLNGIYTYHKYGLELVCQVDELRVLVHSALNAPGREDMDPPPSVPAGWKLVPIEPNEKMIRDGAAMCDEVSDAEDRGRACGVWTTMLASAPLPPHSPEGVVNRPKPYEYPDSGVPTPRQSPRLPIPSEVDTSKVPSLVKRLKAEAESRRVSESQRCLLIDSAQAITALSELTRDFKTLSAAWARNTQRLRDQVANQRAVLDKIVVALNVFLRTSVEIE